MLFGIMLSMSTSSGVDDMSASLGAHLVGSIPADTAEEAFRLAATHMGDHVERLPDGEVGERDYWIRWQYAKIGTSDQLKISEVDSVYVPVKPFRVVEGVTSAAQISFPDLGYAKAAIESFGVFSQLIEEGVVRDDVRFQVGLPTPLSVALFYVEPDSRASFETAYERALLDEISAILDQVPADQLAIQWETVSEFALLEGLMESHIDGDLREAITTRVARLVDVVPEGADVGLHLCYGDSGHKHFCEPKDTGFLTDISRGVIEKSTRPVTWIHMPVPRDRDDQAYFEPLRQLVLPTHTRLYLGLVHHTDGEAGTARRIATARQVVTDFGIATECGLGRRHSATIAGLMQQHANLSQPVSSL